MKKSICFISRSSHFLLLNQSQKHIGGAEFQQVVIANALRKRGWRVSFITERIDNGSPRTVHGITLIPALDYSKGSRITRRIFTLPLQIWKNMYNSDAHVYYQRNPGPFSAVIGIFCRLKRRRFVIAGASDANFHRTYELNVRSYLDVLDIKCGIQLAHTIILQTKTQRYLLKKHYGRDGPTFYNLYDPPPFFKLAQFPTNRDAKLRLLWIGRLAKEKRPELCLDLARLLPDFEILMVGGVDCSRPPHVNLAKTSQTIPNLSYVGPLALLEVEELFDSAQGFINTSCVEGFPNTFLQAWSRGLPVFSFVDPDDLIAKHRLGVQVSSIEQMAVGIRKALNDKMSFMQQAEKIRLFFRTHFSVSRRISHLEQILLSKT